MADEALCRVDRFALFGRPTARRQPCAVWADADVPQCYFFGSGGCGQDWGSRRVAAAARCACPGLPRVPCAPCHFPSPILPTFCLLSVTGSPRMSEGHSTRCPLKNLGFSASADIRRRPDYKLSGENRGSSPLGACPDYRSGEAKTRSAGRDLALSRPLAVR
jgi:hypothetical protein